MDACEENSNEFNDSASEISGVGHAPECAHASSDEDAEQTDCPLCLMDEIEPEHASASLATNNYMRRIMAQELMLYGTCPDKVIYGKIARMYNRHIHRSMIESNLQCERWTTRIVQTHFEQHVWLLPRRLIGQLIKDLNITMSVLKRERAVALRIADVDETEILDAKFVTKMCNLAAKIATLTREYRTYQKEDMLQTQVKSLCKAVELGTTSATDAKQMLDRVALLQSSAGGGDRPNANELFTD